MKKLLFTRLTLKRKMPLVVLHVIMHGVLILFDLLAYSTDVVSLCVFLICVWYVFGENIAVGAKLNFSRGGTHSHLLEQWLLCPPPQ